MILKMYIPWEAGWLQRKLGMMFFYIVSHSSNRYYSPVNIKTVLDGARTGE